MKVKIIGGGLAGVEAAYFLANRGIEVILYEMRPLKYSEAHQTDLLAELVCSNSLRSNDIKTAVGLLKREMGLLDSLVMKAAKIAQIPGGTSLMVDRDEFSKFITNEIYNHDNIKVINQEVTRIDLDIPTIIAAGPLVSHDLVTYLVNLTGAENLNFYDAVSPILSSDSINLDICYSKDRYQEGKGTYLNCPMTKDEYNKFYEALIKADRYAPKDFEKEIFEACMPIEVMAERGYQTPLFGPLKPVGLEIDGNRPYAVVQLRPEDFSNKMYNLVGFQTSLRQGAQRDVIRLIPGLENAEILRYGVIHRNTYFNSPKILDNGFKFKKYPNLYLVGQISGVEGYVESAASGIAAAINLYSNLMFQKDLNLPSETILGSLSQYVSTSNPNFVPMNANFGIVPALSEKVRKKERREVYAQRSLDSLNNLIKENKWI